MRMLNACPKLDHQTGTIEIFMQHAVATEEKELKKTKMRQKSMFLQDEVNYKVRAPYSL